jgi:glycosyltransferase involved in cell wall biosynthesis
VRVLCVAAAYPPHGKGGGPKGSENIARALTARGHTVRVVTVGDQETLEIRDGIEIKTLGCLNVYWNYWKPHSAVAKLLWHALENFNPRALLRMRREMIDFRPDIVVTISIENVNVATWVAARLLGCPSVHVIQSYFLMCWKGTMFSKNKNCEQRCFRCRAASLGKKLCSQLVHGAVAEASHSLSLHHDEGFFRRATRAIIPAAVMAPKSPPRFGAAETDPLRVGYIGMLTPNKGVGTLGDAAMLLEEDALEYRLAGDGDPAFVQQVLAKFPAAKTAYLGWVDADSFYRSIDVLVVPSIWAEPFGYVCIEALSYGIPVIVARSGALAEIVEPGKSGLVFKAGDHQALAACLRKLAGDRDLVRNLHEGAAARAKRYSPEALAEFLDTFLKQIHAATKKAGWRPALGSARTIPSPPAG